MKVNNRTSYDTNDLVTLVTRCLEAANVHDMPESISFTYRNEEWMVGHDHVRLSLVNHLGSPLEKFANAGMMPAKRKLALIGAVASWSRRRQSKGSPLVKAWMNLSSTYSLPFGATSSFERFDISTVTDPLLRELLELPVKRKGQLSVEERLAAAIDARDIQLSKLDAEVEAALRALNSVKRRRFYCEAKHRAKIEKIKASAAKKRPKATCSKS